ncbi:MAG: hypothetical protein GY940_05690 [bacterium]|nr:hypothetical protein [bacterium]
MKSFLGVQGAIFQKSLLAAGGMPLQRKSIVIYDLDEFLGEVMAFTGKLHMAKVNKINFVKKFDKNNFVKYNGGEKYI